MRIRHFLAPFTIAIGLCAISGAQATVIYSGKLDGDLTITPDDIPTYDISFSYSASAFVTSDLNLTGAETTCSGGTFLCESLEFEPGISSDAIAFDLFRPDVGPVTVTEFFDSGTFANAGSYSTNTALNSRSTGTGTGSLSVVSSGVSGGAGGVPEPATWAMMLAGFGLIGAAMRRARVSSRFA